MDCLVSCVLEWAHTFSDEKWSTTRPGLEYRVQVSEWLLHSSKDDYLFSPTDKDAHAPLLIHITPRHFSAADLRATQRPESKMDRNARRKERQKIHKAQAASGATSGTTGTTSIAPPPSSGTSAPTTPPKSAPTSDKGKSKAKGKRETSADAGKGSPSQKVTRTARRARRGTPTTARAKARSERGLRRMLKSFSGIPNRGPSQSVFTAPRGCEYLYSVPRLPCRVECLWKAHRCMRNPIVLQRSQKRSPIFECSRVWIISVPPFAPQGECLQCKVSAAMVE